MTDRCDVALDFVLPYEGGYQADPSDPGNAGGRGTNRGITQGTYDGWRAAQGLPFQDVKASAEAEARAIYRTMYWLPGGCDQLPAPLDVVHMDSMVQHGSAKKLLQRALGVAEDGQIGPGTLAAAAAGDPRYHARGLLLVRVHYYDSLDDGHPELTKWLTTNWLKRLEKLQHFIGC